MSNGEIPFIKNLKAQKCLLETLKELHTGELFAELKLQDIADSLTVKSGEKISAKKVSVMIRNMFGDHSIEVHKSRYYAVICIDLLNKALERYRQFKI